jgi:sulfonate transport system substrate-binding protein
MRRSLRPTRRPALRTLTGLLATAALAGIVLTSCSSDASTRAAADGTSPSTTAAPVEVEAEIPDGVTLRVGDQLDYLQTVLELAGEDGDFPYTVEYSAFVGGPPMLQAFQAGALDTGFVGSTPLIFAQAQGQGIQAVAGWATPHGSYGLVTGPDVDDISDWADLEGHTVAYQQGTAGEAAVLEALDTAGLALDDITPVNVPLTETAAALQSGAADAGVLVEPLISVYLEANPTGAVVATAEEITDRSSFVIASPDALDDPGVSAALGDYIGRVVRSFAFLQDHQDLIAQAVYVDTYGLSPERAAEVVGQAGPPEFFALPGDVLDAQQRLADLFQANGEIPETLDVSAEFDNRYNDLVAEAAGQ